MNRLPHALERDRLSPAGIAAVLSLHVIAGAALLSHQPTRQMLAEAAPTFVRLLAPDAPQPRPLEPPKQSIKPIPLPLPPQVETPPPPPPPAPAPPILVAAPSPIAPPPRIEAPTPPPEPPAPVEVKPAKVVEAPIAAPVIAAPVIAAPISTPIVATIPALAPPAPPQPPALPSPIQAAPQPAPPAPPSVPITPPNFNAAYLSNPVSAYPLVSQRLGEQGRVLLRVVVEANGLPSRVEVEKTSGYPRLDNAGIETVKRWKFVPARQGDQPIAGIVMVPVVFKLN